MSSGLLSIGLSIGQQRHPSALCVVELEKRTGGSRATTHHLVRHLERLSTGTRYPEIAERLAHVLRGVRARAMQEAQRPRRPEVFVDATGLGQPLVDLLAEETRGLSQITAVYFNHGDQCARDGRTVRLGKAYLVSRLQTLLQTGTLHLPSGQPAAKQLAEDLLDFQIEIDERANERYGAFRVGRHDDMVTALGLAVHQTPRTGGVY